MEQYQRATERFRAYGIDLNSPPDSLRPGYYNILENVRSYADGILQPRQGLNSNGLGTVIAGKSAVHSIRQLNDATSGSFIYAIGTGNALAWWDSGFTQAQYNASNVVFSGNPLSMIPYRPDQSTASWMYIADSTAMYKIIGYNSQSIAKGTVHKIGIPPPTTAPVVELDVETAGSYINFGALGTAPNNWVRDNVVLTTAPAVTYRIPPNGAGFYGVTKILYDSGASGWCSIVAPAPVMQVLGVGEAVGILDSSLATHFLNVQEIYSAGGASGITVGSILYDNAPTNTGVCIIQPNRSVKEIKRNAVVLMNGTTYARVTDVIDGPDGTLSFRCSTGATTISAGQTLTVVASFRTYDAGGSIAAGDSIQDYGNGSMGPAAIITNGAGTSTNKTGWVQFTPTANIDLTQVPSFGVGLSRSFTDDDYVHVGTLISDVSKVVQGRIMLDCDNTSLSISSTANNGAGLIRVTTTANHLLATGDTVFINNHNASTNGTWIITVIAATTFDLNGSAFVANAGAVGTVAPQFKKNFFYRAFTPSDLITAVKGTQTAIDNRTTTIIKNQIDRPFNRPERKFDIADPNSPGNNDVGLDLPDPVNHNPNDPGDGTSATRTTTGDYNWSDIIFRRGDFVRVGSDPSRGFANITAVRVEFTFADTTAMTVALNSFTMYGGYEPDTADLALPYIYRYRYRASTTGARSNWSPANRSGVIPQRGQVAVTCTAASGLPEVDRIDIQRLGGTSTTWLTIGSTTNASPTFTDKISDIAADAAAPLSEGDTNYQPWPVRGKPISSATPVTTVTVVGPYLKDTTAVFNTAWAKGTPIKIGGVDTQIRRVISTSLLECDNSMGSQSNVSWEIPEPLIAGQPLPLLWGPWNGYFFACGDTNNPGTLYFSNGTDPDTTTDTNYIEVTSPSEPLMNGCTFNGKSYVWSSERMFEVQEIGIGQFLTIEIPGEKGLFKRWALTTGERIWFLARDGIYQTNGGDPVCITDETLRPLFKHEGQIGISVNGFNPPSQNVAFSKKQRLSYYDGRLYFTYTDSAAVRRCLSYVPAAEKTGWWPDVYLDGTGVEVFYGAEGDGIHTLLAGGSNEKLYFMQGTSDDGVAIPCHIRTQYFDAGDRRADKRWGDFVLDVDPNNANINANLYNNNDTTSSLSLTPTTVTSTTRTQALFEIATGGDPATDYSRNIALDITWTSTTATPKLYLWEPSYITRPEAMDMRATQWDDAGVPGDKFFQGIEIDANTGNLAKTVFVEYDGLTTNVGDTLTLTHNNRQIKAYAFRPAFTAATVRLHSTDAVSWELYNYKWLFQPEPPRGDRWETQQVSFGANSFVHAREMWVTMRSTQAVTLTVNRVDDNSTTTYTIPTTSGLRLKQRVIFTAPATKGKTFIFTFSSTGIGGTFRLYKPETVVLVKPWQSEDAFTPKNVFGGESGMGEAPI